MREVNGIDPGLNRKTKPNLRTPHAHITGASWGVGATAQRQAWRRARPSKLDTFLD
jgi:hypothetical protein